MSLISQITSKINAFKADSAKKDQNIESSKGREATYFRSKTDQESTVDISSEAARSAQTEASKARTEKHDYAKKLTGLKMNIDSLTKEIAGMEALPENEQDSKKLKEKKELLEQRQQKYADYEAKILEFEQKEAEETKKAEEEQAKADAANSQIESDDSNIQQEQGMQVTLSDGIASNDKEIESLQVQLQEAETIEQEEKTSETPAIESKQPETIEDFEKVLKDANNNFKGNGTIENQQGVFSAMSDLAGKVITDGTPAQKEAMADRLERMIKGNSTGDLSEIKARLAELRPNSALLDKPQTENDSSEPANVPASTKTSEPVQTSEEVKTTDETKTPEVTTPEEPEKATEEKKTEEKKEPTFADLAAKYQHHKDEAIAASKREGGDSQRVANMEQGYSIESKLKEMSADEIAKIEKQIFANKDILTNSRRDTDTTKALQDETKALEGMRDAIKDGDFSKYQKIKTEYEEAKAEVQKAQTETTTSNAQTKETPVETTSTETTKTETSSTPKTTETSKINDLQASKETKTEKAADTVNQNKSDLSQYNQVTIDTRKSLISQVATDAVRGGADEEKAIEKAKTALNKFNQQLNAYIRDYQSKHNGEAPDKSNMGKFLRDAFTRAAVSAGCYNFSIDIRM